jgi:hypothetical protein
MSTIKKDLIGTWDLVEYSAVNVSDNTDVYHPLGRECNGRITYTPDGFMTAYLQRSDMVPYSVDWQQCLPPPSCELSVAAAGTLAYTGRYRFDDSQQEGASTRLRHEIDFSLPPNWNGTSQIRLATVGQERGQMILCLGREDVADIRGAKRVVQLKWAKMAAVEM